MSDQHHKPLFETSKSFADVPINTDGIPTIEFLEASDPLMNMFDLLGSGVFGFVQNDIRSNIVGVRNRYEAHRDSSGTLEKLVEAEKSEGQKHAVQCMVRLVRGLAFTCSALQHTENDTDAELHTCFTRAYNDVLRKHHSIVVRGVVKVALLAVPHKQDFIKRLAQGGSQEKFHEVLRQWLVGLDAIVKHMSKWLQDGGYGRV